MLGEMNTNLKVEDLQMDVMITETYPGKGVLALANVKIGNFVTIRNVRIKKDDYGFTVAMPKTKGNAAGQYQDTVYFANREAKEKFDQVVLKEYEDYIHQPTALERREQGREDRKSVV